MIFMIIFILFLRLSTARGRAYSGGKIGHKEYELMYLLKGIGEVPIGHAQSSMFVLALYYGYEIPLALLEVILSQF